MNILLISECNKKALVETRRIIDQFAERKGERTWQTAITLEGLNTLRRLLKKTARRNTAIACHWIKSNNQTEIIWIVGNIQKFNHTGAVPTNITRRDIVKLNDENQWQQSQIINLLASIAALFHDFGKASRLFQNKLKGKGKSFEPFRHEWLSLRLFQAFVGGRDDRQWLEALALVSNDSEKLMLANLITDPSSNSPNPFVSLPPLASVIGWLIISHHRLPVYPSGEGYDNSPPPDDIDHWLTSQLSPDWNSTNHHADWTEEERDSAWQFPYGTPIRSELWRAKAQKFAGSALRLPSLLNCQLSHTFACHMARLVMMLADHHYSSSEATAGWQSPEYGAWANTDRLTRLPKQKLDEHNIGVSQNAYLLGKSLPTLRGSLPAISHHKGFKKRSTQEQFRWQDKAFDLACSIRERAEKYGFFGVNMASTGCGKTLANARIMYGLADERRGCRFSVALGLRTLTLQTGDALGEKLHLDEDDLAVMIGSQAVLRLHQRNNDRNSRQGTGSQSAESLFAEHQYIRYDGMLDDGRLSRWLKQTPALHRLLSAPVLVTTIDHLMPACESLRGGHQIAPMLRLLTSDLVLDEPDDFDMADLPALCRLVNWAGMLGSRVLLSSATLAPSLVLALFNAYRTGRQAYQQACGEPGLAVNVPCAWFDENGIAQSDHASGKTFHDAQSEFVARRVAKLQKSKALRSALLVDVITTSVGEKEVLDAVAVCISQSVEHLHNQHFLMHESKKRVSVGLVRMANIDPLVAVARRLMIASPPADTRIHYCVYHSRHPLAMRSHIENRLDATLTRYDPTALWQVTEICHALAAYPEKNHIFVVLATSVAEVGRDHDYDWVIAEPSSMRSLIQLAGRLQRHRQQSPTTPNMHILHKNVKALKQTTPSVPAYCKPGFETPLKNMFSSHDLHQLLEPQQYQIITAIPRILVRAHQTPNENFVDLEHHRLQRELMGSAAYKECAAQWWRHSVSWCGELQRKTPFRQSVPDKPHYLWISEEGDEPLFRKPDDGIDGWKDSEGFKAIVLEMATGVSAWMDMDYGKIYQQLADELEWELPRISATFGEIRLTANESKIWHWHPLLGVFGALE